MPMAMGYITHMDIFPRVGDIIQMCDRFGTDRFDFGQKRPEESVILEMLTKQHRFKVTEITGEWKITPQDGCADYYEQGTRRITIENQTTGEIYTEVDWSKFDVIERGPRPPNEHYDGVASNIDLLGRLVQIFLDADDLMSDLTNNIQQLYIESVDAKHADSSLKTAIKQLEYDRSNVHNIVSSFYRYYLDQKNN